MILPDIGPREEVPERLSAKLPSGSFFFCILSNV